MNAMSDVKGMVLNADGQTYRYPGVMQWAMSVADQKRCGLLATVNVSIHPGRARAGKTAKHHQ